MTRYISDQNKTALLYESGTYASTSGTGHWIGLVTDHTMSETENQQQIRYTGTASRNVDKLTPTTKEVDGAITFHPQDFKMLFFALGSNVDAGVGPYTHTMSEVNSDDGYAFTSGTLCPFASFTIEDSQSTCGTGNNFIRTVVGAMEDSYELSWSEGEIAESTINYVAQDVSFSSGATTALSEPSTPPFVSYQVKTHIPSGTVIDTVTEGTFTISNNTEKKFYNNGSRVTAAPIPGNRDYEVSLTLNPTATQTKTFYENYFRGGSEFNMMLDVQDLVTVGAGSRSCFITLSGCKLDPMEAPSKNEGANEQTVTIIPKSVSAVATDSIPKYCPW